jgi:hypothetical protein
MTNRRSLQGYSLRESRELQFTPGHVGGRVASAQPVARRIAIGAVTAQATPASAPLRPIDIVTLHVNDPAYIGGAGDNTLRDQSDATYVTAWYIYGGGWADAAAAFEPADIPSGATITGLTLTVRSRSTDGADYWGWQLNTFDADPTDFVDYLAYKNAYTAPAGSWTNYTYVATAAELPISRDADCWDAFPTVADLNEGKVVATLHGPTSGLVDMTVDYADVWLEVSWT